MEMYERFDVSFLMSFTGIAMGKEFQRQALIYWSCIALLILVCGWFIVHPLLTDSGSDTWQHLAALQALIDAPLTPANPFVATKETSRLFGPYWVAAAVAARASGHGAMWAFCLGGFANLALFGVGVWMFGRSYFSRSDGPIALLAAMLLGWVLPPTFTGYHSLFALIATPSFPAVAVIGGTLAAWALAIDHLNGKERTVPLGLLLAYLFATHPMGAAVTVTGVGSFAIFERDVGTRRRVRVLIATALGLGLSALWPYFNPFGVLLTAGRSVWLPSQDFYSAFWLITSLFPAVIGAAGLWFTFPRSLPLVVLLAIVSLGFALGSTALFGAGHRLLPVVVLILHIGLASIFLSADHRRVRRWSVILVAALIPVQLYWTVGVLRGVAIKAERNGDMLAAARYLVADLAPGRKIAGYHGATMPIVGVGRRVFAIAFPEPGIHDQRERFEAADAIFTPGLSAKERLGRARSLGIDTIFVDKQDAPARLIADLETIARARKTSGSLLRFDL